MGSFRLDEYVVDVDECGCAFCAFFSRLVSGTGSMLWWSEGSIAWRARSLTCSGPSRPSRPWASSLFGFQKRSIPVRRPARWSSLGAVAELERSLIAERVKAGLRNARAKGKRLGRPRVVVDAPRIAALRAQARSWREVCVQLRLTKGTAQRAIYSLPKNPAVPKNPAGGATATP